MANLVTFFTTCKPFYGEAALTQNNALLTWQAHGVPILICGDEDGAADAAQRVGAHHVTNIERSGTGMPYIRSIFSEAKKAADTPFLAYVNSDIIVTKNLYTAMNKFVQNQPVDDNILLTFRRRNIPVSGSLLDQKEPWPDHIRSLDDQYGSWDQSNAIDFFLFNRDLYDHIIPLVVGHMAWDNWLLWKAHDRKADIIDGSMEAALFHPIHGYASDGSGLLARSQGKDAVKNRALAGKDLMTLGTATTHSLLGGKTRPYTDDIRAQMDQHCQPDTRNEFKAGVEYLRASLQERSADEILDCCRTILWRRGRFFPLIEASDTSSTTASDDVSRAIIKAHQYIENANIDAAENTLQDLVANRFLARAKDAAGSRDLYIWGCGMAGQRLAAFLRRHSVPLAGYLDRDTEKTGTEIGGLEVKGATVPIAVGGRKPYLLIGSMFAAEISASFAKTGLSKDTDYIG